MLASCTKQLSSQNPTKISIALSGGLLPLRHCKTIVWLGSHLVSPLPPSQPTCLSADLAHKYPLAAQAVDESFYVDDGLTGADSTEEAIELQQHLQDLFSQGGFLLHKWNSSDPTVLQHIAPELKDSHIMHTITDSEAYTKMLGIEWNSNSDHFWLPLLTCLLSQMSRSVYLSQILPKRLTFWDGCLLLSLKWIRLWELKIDWDDPVPHLIKESWLQWRSELQCLSGKHISCYFPKSHHSTSWVLWCIRRCLRWCNLPPINWLQWKRPLLSRHCQNDGCSYQAPNHSSFRALWCTSTRSTSPPHQGSLSSLSPGYLHLDWLATSFSIGCLAI